VLIPQGEIGDIVFISVEMNFNAVKSRGENRCRDITDSDGGDRI